MTFKTSKIMYSYYNRRQFLQFISLLTGSGLLACTQKKSPVMNQAQVLIIGAGIAGLAAARELKSQGIEVTILEGRSRIGGRVYSDRSLNNLPLDMGASWIHGIDNNPIYKLAQSGNIKTLETDYEEIELYSNNKFLSDQEQEIIDRRLEDILKEARKIRKKRSGQNQADISLRTAIEEVIINGNRQLFAQQLRELDYAINTTIEHEYAADVTNLSLYYWDQAWDQDSEIDGKDVLFPGGYSQIIDLVAQNLDIKLNQIVKKITYNNQGVVVTTNQGNFSADKVIITLPLGVLKKGSVEFSPQLPEPKVNAINRLGMGVLNKLYLQFPQVFWDKETHLLGYISANKGEWAEWINIYRYTKQPILLGFNAGSFGKAIELLSDKEIINQAMQTLRQMYGSQIPDPSGFLLTRWQQDPFSYGSYSYMATGATLSDRKTLGEPVDNRLFFAGEATSQKHPATVHGAFLSGLEAAKKIHI